MDRCLQTGPGTVPPVVPCKAQCVTKPIGAPPAALRTVTQASDCPGSTCVWERGTGRLAESSGSRRP